ncbi:origin recognition complex subunit 6-like isoform X2 [Ptychodera flava]|uniref:origin recognition complex subunit 6-like isoform X2 n=1 Tax=Ptychodera flava TaxID=63121 RepID=UPI003969BEF2
MEGEIIHRLAPKLGVSSSKVLRKSEELLRLCGVRLTSSNFAALSMTGSCKAVMCIDLAASSMDQHVNKDVASKVAGMKKRAYTHTLKTLENSLDLQPKLTVRDVAVQFGCVQATALAQQILQRYESEIQSSKVNGQEDVVDFSMPMYPAAAVYTACRCLKVKIDKSKILSLAGIKKTTFEKLCSAMETHAQKLLDKKAINGKRAHQWTDDLEKSFEDEESSSKHSLGLTKSPRKKSKTDDYEDWKRRILEEATSSDS